MSSSEALRIPDLPAHFIGRDEQARHLEAKLLHDRLVAIVGAGGLGKTTLAVAVARRMAPAQADGACFVDLASLGDGELLGARVAAALGIDAAPARAHEQVRQFLRARRMLLVLDSCETVIDAAARLAEDILSNAPAVLLLVTSREPLQADGEQVHRLAPLGFPPQQRVFPAWLAMTYPAVQLFFRIARDRHAELAASRQNIDRVAALCRQLEGSPLAIQLAASHVARLGLEGVAAQVDGSMLTLAAPEGAGRHRSLEAVLAWSYRLLEDAQQRALRSLACFRGSFDLAAALAVADEGRRTDTSAAVLDLVDKSLLATVQAGDAMLYRMADTTRAFAAARLDEGDAGLRRAARRRHAQYLVRWLGDAQRRWDSMARADWRQHHGPWVDDVRHALEWAFSADGDRLLAIELTVPAFGLAEQTALFPDYTDYIERALDEVDRLEPARPDLALRLRTFPALDQLRTLSDDPRQLQELVEAVEIGRATGSVADQLGTLLTVFAHRFQLGDYAGALGWSGAMQRVADAHADPVVDLTARRTRAQALHFLGQHGAARELARAICSRPNPGIPLAYTPSPVSADVSMRIVLARILWLEGCADQALQMVDECLALCEHDAPQSHCQALAFAALPIGLWCGHAEACRAWIERLAALTGRHDYAYWQAWGRFYAVRLGVADAAARDIARREMLQPQQVKYRDHLATFDAAAAMAETCARVAAGSVGWCAPEVLRVQAARAIDAGSLDVAARQLARAIELSRAQGALAWELRAAMTAMRLSMLTGTATRGREVLAAVYGRFGEGFHTQDLRQARALLAAGA